MIRIFLAILIAPLLFGLAFPNFRILSIMGGNLSSPKATHASILEELVRIKLFRDTCRVNCKFWVKSETENESLAIAFPNSLNDYLLGLSNDTGVGDFSVAVDGKTVPHFQTRDSALSFGKFKKNSWFVFKANLAKNKVSTIECSYRDKWYGAYDYLIGTGITWHGSIGKGRIVFDFSPVCSKLFVQNPKTYNRIPDPAFPEKLTGVIEADSIVYSFKNYRPDSSEIVSARIFEYWNDSAEQDFLDTVPIYYDVSGSLFYGFKNSFLYEFLSDTAKYGHRFDFPAIKAEVVTRTNGFYGKRSPKNISSQEKITMSILSGNLDSLKSDLLNVKNLEAEIHFDSLSVISRFGNKRLKETVYSELFENISFSPEDMEMFKNIFRGALSGDFEIKGFSQSCMLIDSVDYVGKKTAAFVYPVLAEMMGLVKGRFLSVDFNKKCGWNFKVKAHIKIRRKGEK